MIPVLIVESHQHVLEHVHEVLRKQQRNLLLSLGGQDYWSMLHFDAHPDLACPTHVPAAACFAPRRSTAVVFSEDTTTSSSSEAEEMNNNPTKKNLYELLDETTSGIAEWILPLVLAGNLRHIEWVKPSFSHQLQVGDYRYSVGVDVVLPPHGHRGQQDTNAAPTQSISIDSNNNESEVAPAPAAIGCFLDLPHEARIKVDWCHPYYLDDDAVVPTDNLVLKQTLHLRVSELSSLAANTTTTKTTAPECDSSSTQHHPCSNQHHQQQQPWMLDICLDYFVCHNPYLTDIERISPTASQTLVDIMQTTEMMQQQQQQVVSATREMDHAEGLLHYQRNVTTFAALLKDILQCGSLTPDVAGHQLDNYFCLEDRAYASDLVRKLLQAIGGNATLREAVVEALPNNWSMPHAPKSLAEDQLKESLRLFEQAIVQRTKDDHNNEPPFLITIARSTNDGFTPASVVEFLQSEILLILERIFGKDAEGKGGTSRDDSHQNQGNDNSDGYQLRIVRDYGEWEGSTIYDA